MLKKKTVGEAGICACLTSFWNANKQADTNVRHQRPNSEH